MIVNLSTHAKKAGVFLQLAALLLIQSAVFLPVLHKAVSQGSGAAMCYHDHRLCGCSPARVADHTCCCALSGGAAHAGEAEADEPPCCALKHQAAKTAALSDKAAPQRFINAPPCGSHPQFVSASLDKIKFVRVAVSVLTPGIGPLSYPPMPREMFRSISVEPPTPPPESAIYS